MFTSLTAILIASGIILSTATLLTSKSDSDSSNNNTSDNNTKAIRDFSYDKIKTVLEYELYGKSCSEIREIARNNNYSYPDEDDINIYDLARRIASSAQYGNRIYPSYLEGKIESKLNEKYN